LLQVPTAILNHLIPHFLLFKCHPVQFNTATTQQHRKIKEVRIKKVESQNISNLYAQNIFPTAVWINFLVTEPKASASLIPKSTTRIYFTFFFILFRFICVECAALEVLDRFKSGLKERQPFPASMGS
jgi:hypothetical protein